MGTLAQVLSSAVKSLYSMIDSTGTGHSDPAAKSLYSGLLVARVPRSGNIKLGT